ncbi:hypothetical protein QQ008_03320 [Fulvivirgaceae bacterium BMA10]|uniref:Uncharacterized protein n=1 Tax=Splendidivirga corallicola TaxID=3051826 RepID=A0ABT8KI21_9BACT|nr:hypothetical protein [Fulvivirgaceae bacterium BMA10]
MTIETAIEELQSWLDIKYIEGIAQGQENDESCITVFISNSQIRDVLPSNYKGFRIVVEETGTFNSLGL